MSFSAGTRFGAFEILSLLGAGGMGEVYRARDARLNRDVALKVLPEAFTADPDRLARFTREAQVLASLNHSNIGAIHGLEDAQGRQALVLELVEGPTLADRIAQGALPLEEALPIARQIADALEAAHEQGIIHRDLKPANIKLRPDGAVKVLDFGLAKAMERNQGQASSASRPDVTASPTLLSPATMTGAGLILGTAAYMAPEQARGKAVDHRADIWAFGCVLYEMLTGRRAFEGDEITDTLAGILRGDPSWEVLPASLPRSIQRLVRRCLQKDPRQRLQAIGEARIEISDAISGRSEEPIPASPVVVSSRVRRALPLLATAVATALLVGGATWALKPAASDADPRVTRSLIEINPFDHRPPAKPGESRGVIRPDRTALALSPDGRTLVFRSIAVEVNPGGGTQSVLFVRSLDSLTATPIPITTGAESPFFSPDGAWIGYWDGGELRRVPVSGSTTYTTITQVPEGGRIWGASWGDGDVIVYATGQGIWRVPASGGTPERILQAGDNENFRSLPHLLPGSQALLFTRQKTVFQWDDAEIIVRSLATGEEKVLLSDAADARYVQSGHIVFVRRGRLMAAPFDLNRLELTGGVVALVDEVMQAVNMGNSSTDSGAGQFAVATAGTLVYVTGGANPDRLTEFVWVSRDGTVQPLPAPRREFGAPRLAPDGRRILAFTGASPNEGGNRLWVYDIERGSLTPITSPAEKVLWGVWSPDNARIAYQVLLPGQTNLSWRSADGTGNAESITRTLPVNYAPSSWSRDGHLAYVYSDAKSSSDIWVLNTTTKDRPAHAVVQTDAEEIHPAFSPDGKWLAYTSNAAGRWDVYVQPYPGPGPRVLVSPGGGVAPMWRGDGGELYYSGSGADGETMMAVPITATAAGFNAGIPRPLFKNQFGMSTPSRGYDVSPDGRRFLMTRGVDPPPAPSTQMVLVSNFIEELKRRVPAQSK